MRSLITLLVCIVILTPLSIYWLVYETMQDDSELQPQKPKSAIYNSLIVSPDMAQQLESILSLGLISYYQKPKYEIGDMLYRMSLYGSDARTFLHLVSKSSCSLHLIKSSEDEVFGAFVRGRIYLVDAVYKTVKNLGSSFMFKFYGGRLITYEYSNLGYPEFILT